MSNIQAFILGLVQGLAEFLPISSSGHLTLLQMFFGINEAPLALDVLLHFGTLIAVLVVYWKRIVNMILHPLKSELKWLVVATIPAVIAALLLGDLIDAAFKGEYLGYCFLLTSFVLLLGESINRFRSKKHKHVTWYDALIMGCAQAVAIAPGLSRSGCTIAAGMASGLSRKRAADFSFLMSIPAILGSAVLSLKDVYDAAQTAGTSFGAEFSALVTQLGGVLPILIGVVTAAVSGFLAIKLMLALVKQAGMRAFAVYTFLLGAFLIARQVLLG